MRNTHNFGGRRKHLPVASAVNALATPGFRWASQHCDSQNRSRIDPAIPACLAHAPFKTGIHQEISLA